MTCVRRRAIIVVLHKVSGSYISQERYDLESPNLTPTYSTATPDMTSLATSVGSYREKNSKMPWPTALCRISPERFKLGSRNFTHLSRTISLTCAKDGCAGKESNNSATV